MRAACFLGTVVGVLWAAAEVGAALALGEGSWWQQAGVHVVIGAAVTLVVFAALHAVGVTRERAVEGAVAVAVFGIVYCVTLTRAHFAWLGADRSWHSRGHLLTFAVAFVLAGLAAGLAFGIASRLRERAARGVVPAACVLLGALWPAWQGAFPSYAYDVEGAGLATEAPYNVLVVTLDALRRDHVSSYGYAKPTEALFERFGFTRFEDAVAVSSWTRPTTATILTGLYPSTHGAVRLSNPLPAEAFTLAERLRDLGFATAHLAGTLNASAVFGMDQGALVTTGNPYAPPHPLAGTSLGEIVRRRAFDLQDARELTGCASRFVEAVGAGRFALYLHYDDPHTPYDPPPQILQRWSQPFAGRDFKMPRRDLGMTEPEVRHLLERYDGDIDNAFASLARLLDQLARSGQLARTLVIVSADHGESFGERGQWDHSTTPYEELLRIPLFVRPPDELPRVPSVAATACQIDFVPTVLDYLGLAVPAELPGQSLRPWIEGREVGAERLLLAECHGLTEWSCRRGPWKLIAKDDGSALRLFDLRDDRGEQRNLAEDPDHRALAQQLASEGRALREQLAKTRLGGPEGRLDSALRARLEQLGYTD